MLPFRGCAKVPASERPRASWRFIESAPAFPRRRSVALNSEASRIMRHRSQRSFTVETKSGGRHRGTVIPSRVTVPIPPRPHVSWPPPAEPRAPIAEPRRILPSLIVPEALSVEPEPVPTAKDRPPPPCRGRARRAEPAVPEMVVEAAARPTVAIMAAASAPTCQPPASRPIRLEKPAAERPLGERWKRRLGRWAR